MSESLRVNNPGANPRVYQHDQSIAQHCIYRQGEHRAPASRRVGGSLPLGHPPKVSGQVRGITALPPAPGSVWRTDRLAYHVDGVNYPGWSKRQSRAAPHTGSDSGTSHYLVQSSTQVVGAVNGER
ncbi:MAG: hypothetical protein HC828_03535 [Blastochloris sp.]|nr:hypothetical protein [Blastochloris sp.]